VFSGRRPIGGKLTAVADGYLADLRGWQWQALSALPSAASWHPELRSGAMAVARTSGEALIFGGTNGTGAVFRVAACNLATGSWRRLGQFPGNPPTSTQAVWWQGMIVIPAGQIRSGVTTPRVFAARLSD
jgi:hypothetical protein